MTKKIILLRSPFSYGQIHFRKKMVKSVRLRYMNGKICPESFPAERLHFEI